MVCALIMAGGRGDRFWPISTDEKPKQFLKLLGEETMIQMTVRRIEQIIPMERIFVITGSVYHNLVKEQLPLLPERNIIIEPVGRNTAPCIALSAFVIDKYYKDATIAVLPSDHLIKNEEEFRSVVSAACDFVEHRKEAIVTIGMEPDRPETGYGYIKYDNKACEINDHEILTVEKFVEKPCLEVAEQYLKEGNYLWNGGMFVWKTSNILNLTKKYLENTYKLLQEVINTPEDKYTDVLNEKYCLCDSISIDYGVMEKADSIYVIPGDFGWDDVGSWNAVDRIRQKDENQNVVSGEVKPVNCKNNIIMGNKKPIMVVGLEDMFIVESDDVILITKKDHIKDIKELKSISKK